MPLLRGTRQDDYCVPCGGNGKPQPVIRYFTEPAATSQNYGLYHGGASVLRGEENGKTWQIQANASIGLRVGDIGTQDGCGIRNDKVIVGLTEYRTGAVIFDGETSRKYEPQDLEVCEGGQTKTWKVLAYKVP
jgi:hypothetical protein